MKAKIVLAIAAALAVPFAEASFQPNPKGAVKALKVTRGKPFKTGLVFIDGKYIPPPYTIERYGLVLRVNKIQATNPVIPWEEFIKTQEGVTVSKTTTGGTSDAATDAPEPEPEPEILSDDDDPLADLFDDEPSSKKSSPKKPAYKPRPASSCRMTPQRRFWRKSTSLALKWTHFCVRAASCASEPTTRV